jgi:phage terminase large subunit-like protein
MFDERRADRAVRFFEMLRHTKGQFAGQPFELLPWQRKVVRDVYGTVREDGRRQYKYAVAFVPKKNGKSEMVAGAGLYHTFADGERNGEVYGCAADREQASLVFDVAVDMIDQSPALKKRAKLTLSQKIITDKISGTFYKVVSSEAYTKHGLNISACIFDELHAQPNRNLWDVMTKGAGDARLQPIWWVISTAGDDPDRVSIGWEVYERAKTILEARSKGDPENDIPTWYPVIFEYLGDDIYNPKSWATANPSLGKTFSIENLEEAAAEAKQNPADERLFRWLRLNQWVTYKLTTWLPLDLFDQTIGNWDRADLLGKDCYLGMDLSSTTDLTAIALLFPPQGEQTDWRVIWQAWIPKTNMADRIRQDKVPYDQWAAGNWIIPTEGDVVDYTKVEAAILEAQKFYRVIEVPSDRAFAAMLLQRLEQAGLTCVDVPQTFKTMTSPINLVETLLREGKLTHEANPVARWAFGNSSIAKNGNGEIKLVKEHKGRSVDRTKRIDPMVALVNAMARAQYHQGSVDISADILSDDWGM